MSETITMSDDVVELRSGRNPIRKLSVTEFIRCLMSSTLLGLDEEALCDNVKWKVTCGKLTVFIVEFKPELRWIQWLSKDSPVPYGHGAVSSQHRLATPYVVLKVPILKGRVAHRVEVFYRTKPLRGLDDELCWPNLFNVSPHVYRCIAWFCTQNLEVSRPGDAQSALDAVTHHLWGGQFNASSEAHEGKSAFGLSQELGLDPRVTDVDRWEKASIEDPNFVLSVDWKLAGVTVRELIEKDLAEYRIKAVPENVATIGNSLLKRRKPR